MKVKLNKTDRKVSIGFGNAEVVTEFVKAVLLEW